MAIAFARARYISRAVGGSATRSAAYNAREAVSDERTGEVFYFKHRDAPEHHEVLLPDGADARFADSATLWNAAEGAERRKDAQVARELVIALPANRELTAEDRLELVRTFAEEHFVAKGLAVQLDVHTPHEGSEAGETANHHAHLLITTRRIEGDRLASKKARDLDPEVKRVGGRAAVTEGEAWGALWGDHQNRYFAAHGLEIRVDALGAVPQAHVGPVRMRAADSAAVARAEEIARENGAAARDPEKVLDVLTRNNATFTERELDRHLAKHIHDETEHLAVKALVLGHRQTRPLYDRETGAASGRYTTTEVREQERAALDDGAAVAGQRHRRIGEGARAAALDGRSLRADQQAAFDHATGGGGLKIVEGRAGTGKSYTLGAIREAHEGAGYAVIGLAPTNSVAQDLKADGFAQAATAHSELFRLKNGRTTWTPRTLVVVDEAAMLDSRMTGELLAEARRSGAKLILAGDDRQLASIERGGLFTELRLRHGSAEITEVTRQSVGWQRQAARDLAEGRTPAALRAFAREKAIVWSRGQDQAREKLIERWRADTAADRDGSRFVFAYTNKDVDALNAGLRQVRKDRGELGEDVRLETKHGPADFAIGDRVQFTDTLRQAKIYNGNVGTITGVDWKTGALTATIDGVGGGRQVTWLAEAFDGFRHGYAGTIYKGQGKTLDHTYLYHSHHWRQASSYVALTRQRLSAVIFAATETAGDVSALARQMSRGEVRSASVAWATADELPPLLRPATQIVARGATTLEEPAPPSPTAPGDASSPDSGWLIAPRLVAGRPRSGDVAAAVNGDAEVQRERRALGSYLEGAFRDPRRARLALDELVKTHGATSAAQRLSADPGQLGELRGRDGLLAGRAEREARIQAQRAAAAVGPAVARIGAAETGAASTYVKRLKAQRAAEATGVPNFSAAARAAVDALASATDTPGRVEAWAKVRANPGLAGELDRFMQAVEGRFGAEGVRALDRGGAPAEIAAEVGVLSVLGPAVRAIRGGQRAAGATAQGLTAAPRSRPSPRLKP
jgi:Ti-type conjugative transfer relaxase TraA